MAYIFFFVWVGIGHSTYSKEPLTSPCYLYDNGLVMRLLMMNLVCMDLYLIISGIIFVFSLLIIACDEGTYKLNIFHTTLYHLFLNKLDVQCMTYVGALYLS